MSTKIVPISDLRRKAKDVMDTVQQQHDTVYVTQHGRPVAVLVDYGRYEQLLEQLQELPTRLQDRESTQARGTALQEHAQQYLAGEQTQTNLQAALALARQLSPSEKAQLVEQIVPDLARALQARPPTPRKSLRRLWRGVVITELDIAKARREMWGNFPREDI